MSMSIMGSGTAAETAPMSELNTTPLIDVMLVLLVMFIITIPVATHSIPLNLPQGTTSVMADPVKNRIVLDAEDRMFWNGEAINQQQLAFALAQVAAFETEPEVQFEPEGTASYAMSAEVLDIVERSGVTKFGFTGNHKYQHFGKAP